MGCGVSRPITDEQSAPVSGGLRPIRRRIEEIKRRRGVHTIITTSNTPSTKELVDDGRVLEPEEELHTQTDSSVHDHNTKNTEYFASKELSSSKLLEPEKEKEGKVSKSDQYHNNTAKPPPPPPGPILTSGEKRTDMVEKGGGRGGGGGGGEKEKEAEDEDGDNDEEESAYGYIDGPGSPSFRDYYVPSIGNSMELTDTSKEEDANEGGKKEKKSRRNESIASSEGSVTRLVKKGNKGRRFRRALPKGLINVKSCYTPPCTSSHDNPDQLLNPKMVQAS